MKKKFYFVIFAQSRTAADAIAEAHKLAKAPDIDITGVAVHECGTRTRVGRVFADGDISPAGVVAIDGPYTASSDELARGPWKLDASKILDAAKAFDAGLRSASEDR